MTNEKPIPKNVFDKEYSTQWRREMEFLREKGIQFSYAKKHPDYPVTKYKYTKTPELFLALAEFYNKIRVEKVLKTMPLERGYLEPEEVSD